MREPVPRLHSSVGAMGVAILSRAPIVTGDVCRAKGRGADGARTLACIDVSIDVSM